MTRMTSRVVDDSGHGVPGVFIYAQLQGSAWLAGHAAQVEREVRGYSGPDGRWVLDLTPAADMEDPGTWWKIRTYQRATVGVDVPPAPPGDTTVDIAGYLRGMTPPPENPEQYVLTSRLGVVGGVATLGQDGILTASQRPPTVAAPELAHLHQQDILSSVWEIPHPLPFPPAGVEVLDDNGHRQYPRVSWPSASTVRLTFDHDKRGTARLS